MPASVRDLKNRLSHYLRRVQAGERIVVTDRGHPIAELTPIADEQLGLDDRLARLEQAGEVILPRGAGLRNVRPVAVRGGSVSRTLLEDRR